MKCSALSVALVTVLLASLPAYANPIDAFGFGARAVSMSGAMTASAEGFAASHYNPAALALDDRLRIELGYAYMHPELRINGLDLGVDAHRGFQGGFTLAGDLFERTVAFALSLFLPDRLISRIRALPERQARFVMYDNRPQRLVLSASLAVEVLKGLSIGASLSFLSHAKGTLDVSGLVGFTDPEETQLRTGVVEDLVAIRYPTLGVHYSPTPEVKLGVTYREEFSLELELEVLVGGDIVEDGEVTLPDASFALSSDSRTLFSPRQLAFGVAWDAECWQVSVDLTWAQWSRFPTPTASVDMTLNLPGLPVSLPPPDAPLAPHFHDILIPRIGVEAKVITLPDFELSLRGGYAYEASPVPVQSGRTNYIDTEKHSFSAGLGMTLHVLKEVFPEPLSLDLGTQFLYLPSMVVEKANPADPVGDYKADGWWVGGAITFSLLF